MGIRPAKTIESVRVLLKEAASESGLTYQQIGERMGRPPTTARQTVSRLLNINQEYDPQLSTLLAFAEAIDRPLGDILS